MSESLFTSPKQFRDGTQLILDARSIVADHGLAVLGWKVQAPYYAATERLQAVLDGFPSNKVPHLLLRGLAHEAWGDITLGSNFIQDPLRVAIDQYGLAIPLFERAVDFNALMRVQQKLRDIR